MDGPKSPKRGKHWYVENQSCHYMESSKSSVHGKIYIFALHLMFHFGTMGKNHDVFVTWL